MAFSFFFRDAQTLELLVDSAMPTIRGQAFIHVWDAGCAQGAETYTLAMLLRERMSEFLFRNVRIHATDTDAGFAGRVTAGVYADEEVRRIPRHLRAKYFEPAGQPGRVRVIEPLRRCVRFVRHDLLSLVPIREGISLIVCKNVLLHFKEAERCDVLRMFHRVLRPDGLLALEHTQKLPGGVDLLFEPVADYACVFRRRSAAIAGVAPERARPTTGRRRLRVDGEAAAEAARPPVPTHAAAEHAEASEVS